MRISDASLRLAIKNIAAFGDTDIFPVPIEKYWFGEEPEVVFDLLVDLRKDLERSRNQVSIYSSTELVNVGYFGFRAGTQIDPLWNALLLASTIEVAEQIENKRQPEDNVLSYRFSPDRAKGLSLIHI